MRAFALAILTVLFVVQASAAKLEFLDSPVSASLSAVADSFEAAVEDSEQALETSGPNMNMQSVAFKIVSVKPGEKPENTIKQALYKRFSSVKSAAVVALENPNTFQVAYEEMMAPLSWSDGSAAESFDESLREQIATSNMIYSAKVTRNNSTVVMLALTDKATNEVLLIGLEQ